MQRFLIITFLLSHFPDPGGGDASAPIIVKMEDSKASRRGKLVFTEEEQKDPKKLTERLLKDGWPKDELTKRGVVEVDGHKYGLYLPKAKSYTIKNTGTGDSEFENTSTLISIDQNGDGKLQEEQQWFANLPIRLGDTMFDVVEIAADGSQMVLKRSKSPLSGVIVGRSCPPFAYKTADGKEFSRDGLAGKAFILDIWSITWHSCIEGFPLVQRVQQRVGVDKLAVVLIDVDPGYGMKEEQFLPQAKQILAGRKLDWPNVIAPRGFTDTIHTFNVSGYGKIVVDGKGIVRGVNVHGPELERIVDEVVAPKKPDKVEK